MQSKSEFSSPWLTWLLVDNRNLIKNKMNCLLIIYYIDLQIIPSQVNSTPKERKIQNSAQICSMPYNCFNWCYVDVMGRVQRKKNMENSI